MITPEHPLYKEAYTLVQFIRIYDDMEYAGGELHIVLDDGNIDDSALMYCRDTANNEWAKTLASKLLLFTEEKRYWLLHHALEKEYFWNYVHNKHEN